MTLTSPPVTVAELEALEAEFAPQFSSPTAFADAWVSCRDWYGDKHLTITSAGARSWFERHLERDAPQRWKPGQHQDPLAESRPQEEIALSDAGLRLAIEHGDLHDWTNIEREGPEEHAAHCPRCQLGLRSRRIADDLAAAHAKKPFPGLGATLMRRFADHRERCDDCGAWDDEPPPDTCPRSFWHLPDVWQALHPDSPLADMGSLGPFMRGFLRRQRP